MSSRRQIENGQTTMPECDALRCVHPGTAVVRTAVNEAVAHRTNIALELIGARRRAKVQNPGKTAHIDRARIPRQPRQDKPNAEPRRLTLSSTGPIAPHLFKEA